MFEITETALQSRLSIQNPKSKIQNWYNCSLLPDAIALSTTENKARSSFDFQISTQKRAGIEPALTLSLKVKTLLVLPHSISGALNDTSGVICCANEGTASRNLSVSCTVVAS